MGAKLKMVVGVAANDEGVLAGNLMASPTLYSGSIEVCVQRGFSSAAVAYNRLIDQCRSDILILVHQDVYLPQHWLDKVAEAVKHLENKGEAWGILGVWGVRGNGQYAGRTWCSGGGREHIGEEDGIVTKVDSIDEIVIILNCKAGLRFDEGLHGFHLYATDIILQAEQKGYKTFVFDGPVVHNSRYNPRPVDGAYIRAYRYMKRKWTDRLPVRTCVVSITGSGWPLWKHILRREIRLLRRGRIDRHRHPSPAHLATALGYTQ
jgi:hypothetical protein